MKPILKPLKIKRKQIVSRTLEYWTGGSWAVGHPEHRNMTRAAWEKLRPKAEGWSHPWRLLLTVVHERSKVRP